MKCNRFFVWLVFSTILVSSVFGDENTRVKIRISDSDFPPQYYHNSSGNLTGIDVEIARLLVKAAGLTPEFVARPWSRALSEMQDGNLHMMLNLSITPERSEFMNWIGPERYDEIVFVVQEADVGLLIKSLDDFVVQVKKMGKKVGIQQDVFYGEEFQKKFEDKDFSAAFEIAPTAVANPKKLQVDRILGFFESKTAVMYKMRNDPEYKGLAVSPFIITKSPVYFGISKKGITQDVLKKLVQAYDKILANGQLNMVRNKNW